MASRAGEVPGDGPDAVGEKVTPSTALARGTDHPIYPPNRTESNLRADRVDAVTYDPSISLASLWAIKAFAAHEPTVLLPSHDPEGPARLADRVTR